ncbi:MAG: hypothetical protein LUC38_03755 [Oscillospiraceae bacterium]|nr:hypothetical protein [Ruminococcus sp.]MCD8345059.1 hypothetical protein [Oscillospiraceae bacterium]
MAKATYNNIVELRIAGYMALKEALGRDNALRFMQDCYPGSGDYTKEKYEQPDISVDEMFDMVEEYERTKAAS